MQLDWTTFALEIVNFLVLVWILKHFLYRPVLETIAQRRAGIEGTLAEARQTEQQATALKSQYASRLADWEKEKEAARAAFTREMGAERERQMLALAAALAQERERRQAQETHARQEWLRQAQTQALAQTRRFALALLARLASPELEALLVELFLQDLANLPEEQLAGLRAMSHTSELRVSVVSAYPLDAAQRSRIIEAMTAQVKQDVAVDFSEEGKLMAGLRVGAGAWQLRASLADELELFASSANHADD
jgi:F-type H+-transporting ATPase subunit b